jgi:hypothetical protein
MNPAVFGFSEDCQSSSCGHLLAAPLITCSALPKRFLPLSGDISARAPPVPIPNTAVKPRCPYGTAGASRWESRTSPDLNTLRPTPVPGTRNWGFVLYVVGRPSISDRVAPLRLHTFYMDLLRMIAELQDERRRLDEAIEALERLSEGSKSRRGRPARWLKKEANQQAENSSQSSLAYSPKQKKS